MATAYYYMPASGVGLVLTNHPVRAMGKALRVGVIGLGVGTFATYRIPGDYMRFYETNPEVIQIANYWSAKSVQFPVRQWRKDRSCSGRCAHFIGARTQPK